MNPSRERSLASDLPKIPLLGATAFRYSSLEKAYQAWVVLGQIEAQADMIGGSDLTVAVTEARDVLQRRWGPFEAGHQVI